MRVTPILVLLLLLLGACSAPVPQPPETLCLEEKDQEPIDGGFGGTGKAPGDCPSETPL